MSITLAQLEQEAARRVGPYYTYAADPQVPSSATIVLVYVPGLRSIIEQDSVTNLWLLRRTASAFDRQRQVAQYIPSSGEVDPDAPWQIPPASGEVMEFHHLDPAQELRTAVMAGLRRCFLPENVQVQPTAAYGGIDLTSQYAWLSEPWQIQRVRYGWLLPYHAAPFDTYTQAGHLILTGTHGYMYPTSLWVDCWRPAWTWVNGAESDTGPTLDGDLLDVDLDYAASAAHIEAWHHFPSRCQVAAAGGTQATQAMAAQEFTRQAGLYGPGRPIEVGFQTIVRIGGHHGSTSWVNGPSYPY